MYPFGNNLTNKSCSQKAIKELKINGMASTDNATMAHEFNTNNQYKN